FSSRRRHTRFSRDWSSDVCSSDLPEKANELSGLMITGVFGGAVVPPIMGAMANVLGNQSGSLMVISAAVLYLIVLGFGIRQTSRSEERRVGKDGRSS